MKEKTDSWVNFWLNQYHFASEKSGYWQGVLEESGVELNYFDEDYENPTALLKSNYWFRVAMFCRKRLLIAIEKEYQKFSPFWRED